jgi:hypothetical protein
MQSCAARMAAHALNLEATENRSSANGLFLARAWLADPALIFGALLGLERVIQTNKESCA